MDLEELESAATISWWVWDALKAIAPERATFPRPKRKRGRDVAVNLLRDLRIYHDVELHIALEQHAGRKASYRQAYMAVLERYPELSSWQAINAVHLKERERRDS